MPPAVPSKPINLSSQQTSSQYRDAVSRGVQSKVRQLIQAGILRRARPIKQCSGNWKPRYLDHSDHSDVRIINNASSRMDLIDDPSSPNTIVIFELPGVKNENIVLQIKDRRLVVIGIRVDPFAEAIVAAKSSMEVPASPVSNGTDFAPHISANSLGNVADDPVTPSSTRPSMNKSIRELRYGSFFRSIPVPDGIKVKLGMFLDRSSVTHLRI